MLQLAASLKQHYVCGERYAKQVKAGFSNVTNARPSLNTLIPDPSSADAFDPTSMNPLVV
jgi:hypothetical protein